MNKQIRASVRSHLGKSVVEKVWSSVYDDIWYGTEPSVGDDVLNNVWNNVFSRIWDIKENITRSVKDRAKAKGIKKEAMSNKTLTGVLDSLTN